MLEFCPVCRSLLKIKEENSKVIGFCSCGFKRMSGIQICVKDKNRGSLDLTGKGISNENEEINQVNRICRKCGYNLSGVSEISANESTIFIYKCLKCLYSERETQGTSKF